MVWIHGGAYMAGYSNASLYGPDFFKAIVRVSRIPIAEPSASYRQRWSEGSEPGVAMGTEQHCCVWWRSETGDNFRWKRWRFLGGLSHVVGKIKRCAFDFFRITRTIYTKSKFMYISLLRKCQWIDDALPVKMNPDTTSFEGTRVRGIQKSFVL